MKWIDAIKRVLFEEGQKMHYTDISERVIEKGYRTKVGASPSATAISTITTDITKNGDSSPFLWVAPGEYYLKPEAIVSHQSLIPTSGKEELEVEADVEAATQALIEKGLIKSFGMYWSRDSVLWKNKPSLYGAQSQGSTMVDFADQIGIYR